jgi:NADPH:quinone reductase
MVFDRYGEPDVMRLRDVPVPKPQEDEVLIRVGYAGVNPADSKARAGHTARVGFRYQDVDFPFITGTDAAVSWSGRGRVSPNSNKEIA